MQRNALVLLTLLVISFKVCSAEYRFRDHFQYDCSRNPQPSSIPFLQFYSPHMLQYAVDIDFVVKQTGVCTSLLIALIEQESGLVRQHTKRHKLWRRPFGYLSDQDGFVSQLIDVTQKLLELRQRSDDGYLPAHEPMAYLFHVEFPTGTPTRLLPHAKRNRFRTLYRDMFMIEYHPSHWSDQDELNLKEDLLLRGWQFRTTMAAA